MYVFSLLVYCEGGFFRPVHAFLVAFSPIKGKYQVFLESNLHFLCIRFSLKSYLDQTFITRCDRYR